MMAVALVLVLVWVCIATVLIRVGLAMTMLSVMVGGGRWWVYVAEAIALFPPPSLGVIHVKSDRRKVGWDFPAKSWGSKRGRRVASEPREGRFWAVCLQEIMPHTRLAIDGETKTTCYPGRRSPCLLY